MSALWAENRHIVARARVELACNESWSQETPTAAQSGNLAATGSSGFQARDSATKDKRAA
jgi:hypothetical protein